MKKEDFDKLELKYGEKLIIHYRSNWRGGDGKPYHHRNERTISGKFMMISHQGILLQEHEYPVNYRAIKEVRKE